MMKNYKKCVICGKEFPCPPSAKTVTCSPECRSARARRAASRKRSESERKSLSEAAKKRGVIMGTLDKGTEAAMKSPKAGRFETNSSAKSYTIMSPEGQEYTVTNLMNWIRENIHLFSDDNSDEAVNRVARGFYTIVRNTRLSKRGQRYKGWIVVEHDERKNVEKAKKSDKE